MPNPEQTWQEVSAPLKIDDDKGLPVEQVETKQIESAKDEEIFCKPYAVCEHVRDGMPHQHHQETTCEAYHQVHDDDTPIGQGITAEIPVEEFS